MVCQNSDDLSIVCSTRFHFLLTCRLFPAINRLVMSERLHLKLPLHSISMPTCTTTRCLRLATFVGKQKHYRSSTILIDTIKPFTFPMTLSFIHSCSCFFEWFRAWPTRKHLTLTLFSSESFLKISNSHISSNVLFFTYDELNISCECALSIKQKVSVDCVPKKERVSS